MKKKRHKLLLVFQFTDLISGNNHSFLQYNRVLKKEFDVFYALPDKNGVYGIMSPEEKARVSVISRNTSIVNTVRRLRDLLKVIRTHKIDLAMHVFTFDSPLMILLKVLTHVRLVLFFGASRMTWKHRIYSHFYDRIIVLNQNVLNASLSRTRKLETIPFNRSVLEVFDSSLFSVTEATAGGNTPAPSTRLTLGYMGRIDNTVKGLFELLEALRILNSSGGDYRLRIMGDVTTRKPNDKDLLIEEAKRLGILEKLEFIPASAEPADKERFFRNIDVFCLPSHAEGGPHVVFEAMSFLVPVVATEVGSLPCYFPDKRDILFVKTNDPRDLSEKILQLSRDKTLYETLIANMRQFRERVLSIDLEGQLVSLFKSI